MDFLLRFRKFLVILRTCQKCITYLLELMSKRPPTSLKKKLFTPGFLEGLLPGLGSALPMRARTAAASLLHTCRRYQPDLITCEQGRAGQGRAEGPRAARHLPRFSGLTTTFNWTSCQGVEGGQGRGGGSNR